MLCEFVVDDFDVVVEGLIVVCVVEVKVCVYEGVNWFFGELGNVFEKGFVGCR